MTMYLEIKEATSNKERVENMYFPCSKYSNLVNKLPAIYKIRCCIDLSFIVVRIMNKNKI